MNSLISMFEKNKDISQIPKVILVSDPINENNEFLLSFSIGSIYSGYSSGINDFYAFIEYYNLKEEVEDIIDEFLETQIKQFVKMKYLKVIVDMKEFTNKFNDYFNMRFKQILGKMFS